MYKIVAKKEFVKSISRLRGGNSWSEAKIRSVFKLLASGEALPALFRDHQLKGDMVDYRECHVKHDLLLLYTRDDEHKLITLFNIGTHDDLFGR